MIIYLIGFMGVGKTTLGKKLANRLKIPFYETDVEVSKKSGLTINEIFQNQGEQSFRKLEQQCLSALSDLPDAIVSTGGGTPCFFSNMELMNNMGLTIYLEMPVGGLFERLKNAKANRPLIKDLSDSELKSFITERLNEREKYYKQSKVIVPAISLTVEKLIELLKENQISFDQN